MIMSMSKKDIDNPLVSIFLSTYNRKESVLNTLKRIYQQIYRPIEVIVVDNASSDGSYEEIRSKYKEVQCIRINPPNIGNIKAKNVACKKSNGKYLLSIPWAINKVLLKSIFFEFSFLAENQ